MIKRVKLFARKKHHQQDTSLLMQQTHTGNHLGSSKSYRIYDDCSKLMLDKFEDCLLDNDLTALIISGIPPADVLQQTWDKIYIQFCTLSQNGIYNEVLEINREINDLKNKIGLVNGIVFHLQHQFSQRLVDILNELVLLCDLKPLDAGEVLNKKLNGVVARAKRWVFELDDQYRQLDIVREKKTEQMDRNYFDRQLDELSRFMGYNMKAADTSVARFCNSSIRLHEHNERKRMQSLVGK